MGVIWSSKSGHSGPRKMHRATCASCGKCCDVPFRPTEGRDVFCGDCYDG